MARRGGKASQARAAYERAKRTSKPGEGKRFKALVKALEARGDVEDPAAVAAAIGRRKYGKARFQQMAARGRRRAK